MGKHKKNPLITYRLCKVGHCFNRGKRHYECHFQDRLKQILSELRYHYDVRILRHHILTSHSARLVEKKVLQRTQRSQMKLFGRASPISNSVTKYVQYITTGFLTEYRTSDYPSLVDMLREYENTLSSVDGEFVYIAEFEITGEACLFRKEII